MATGPYILTMPFHFANFKDREVFNDEEPLYDSSLFVENEVKRKIEHFTKERKMSVEKPSYSQVDVWKKDASFQ